MSYKIRRTPRNTDAVEHGLFGNNKGGAKLGSTWDNHKYIARQKLANGWRYFYSQAELRAAQAKQAGKQAANTARNSYQKAVNTVGNSRPVQTAKRKVETTRNEFNSKRAYKNSLRDYSKTVNTHGESSAQARAAANKVKSSLNDYAKSIADNNSNKYDPVKDNDKYNKAEYKSAGEIVRKTATATVTTALGVRASEKIRGKLKDAKESIDKGKSFLDNATGAAKDKATNAADKAKEAASKAADKAQAAADKAREVATKAADKAQAAADRAREIGSKVSPELELEYNYRKAANQADYLGRVTDTKSDAAEKALKKYGRDSQQYKKAYDEMEEAFDQLYEAEEMLKRYERERNK